MIEISRIALTAIRDDVWIEPVGAGYFYCLFFCGADWVCGVDFGGGVVSRCVCFCGVARGVCFGGGVVTRGVDFWVVVLGVWVVLGVGVDLGVGVYFGV